VILACLDYITGNTNILPCGRCIAVAFSILKLRQSLTETRKTRATRDFSAISELLAFAKTGKQILQSVSKNRTATINMT